MTDRLIQVRWEEPEAGGYIRKPGTLATNNSDVCVALCIFDGQLEIHAVGSTQEVREYELLRVLDDLFYVGNDVDTIIADLHKLTVVEFVGKYVRVDMTEELLSDGGTDVISS